MTDVITTAYGAPALERLREVVSATKAVDRMANVSVLVLNGTAGVVARRYLARHGVSGSPGIAGVRFTTVSRLAEELAATTLAPRRPATRTILAAAWRRALDEEPGVFADVADHAATIEALVRAHRELRDLDADGLAAVASGGAIPGELVRIHRSVVSRLEPDWYDESDLLRTAARLPDLDDRVRGAVVLHLPQVLTRAERSFVEALDRDLPVTAIVGRTGMAVADDDVLRPIAGSRERDDRITPPIADAVLSSSDSDDEVRCVGRAVLADLATTPAHRIAVLYAAAEPYAQTLHERFAAMGITMNGPGVRTVADRSAARTMFELLQLAERDLPRNDLFRALSGVPATDFTGERIPLARWERLSREAGVVGGDDWSARITRYMDESRAQIVEIGDDSDQQWRIDRLERSVQEARRLQTFAVELRTRLAAALELRSWRALSAFASDLLQILLPTASVDRMPLEEQVAAAALIRALRGLETLEELDSHASLRAVIDVLQLELDAVPPRIGTFGNGVLVAPISTAIGLDLDRVYVVGLAEDLYPGRIHEDALLPEAVRADPSSQLAPLRRPLTDRYRALLAAMQSASHVTVSVPRGDLRRSTSRLPSRWLLPTLRALAASPDFSMTDWEKQDYGTAVRESSSFGGELLTTALPADRQEWATRAIAAKQPVDDPVITDAVALLAARAGDAFTRFDGNLAGVDGLPDLLTADIVVAPTVLEGYAVCPHAYFVQRLLRVRPLEQPEDIVTIRSMDIGNFIHECMDELVRDGGALPGFGEPWSTAQRAFLQRVVRRRADEYEARGITGHPRLWAAELERLASDLVRILDDDDKTRAERHARVRASEFAFGTKGRPSVEIRVGEGRILMKGSIDRVDQGADGRLYVTDIKSGSDSSFRDIKKGDHLVNGTKLQLPVYAHAARDAYASDDVQAEYWFVRRGMSRIEVPLAAVEDTYAATLAVLADSIRAGVFPNRPPATPDFSYVRCQYCNPDGIGHGEARERWLRKRTDVALTAYRGLVEPMEEGK